MKMIVLLIFLVTCVVETSDVFAMGNKDNNATVNKVIIEDLEYKNTEISRPTDIIIEVKGMVCSFCAQGIAKTIERHDVVEFVNIKLENQRVELYLKKDSQLSDDQIRAMIKESGYEVNKILRKDLN
ncbi:hypothetical protein DID78_03575 [Candidatus Marinamargulisbacteria bacterium SCGC AG-343-D04]|nr:hypothetical protein DID78_03575 [Candidatus Marinamargulisbacteria bacterium SCGC AG-343-D04]